MAPLSMYAEEFSIYILSINYLFYVYNVAVKYMQEKIQKEV